MAGNEAFDPSADRFWRRVERALNRGKINAQKRAAYSRRKQLLVPAGGG